jgi:hypothetical protein
MLFGLKPDHACCDPRTRHSGVHPSLTGVTLTDAAPLQLESAAMLPPLVVSWAMNLGKYDFFPAGSGKGNAVRYLQQQWGACPSPPPHTPPSLSLPHRLQFRPGQNTPTKHTHTSVADVLASVAEVHADSLKSNPTPKLPPLHSQPCRVAS